MQRNLNKKTDILPMLPMHNLYIILSIIFYHFWGGAIDSNYALGRRSIALSDVKKHYV